MNKGEASGGDNRGSARSSLPLAERWRPEKLEDIVGQWEGVRRLRDFALSWAATPRPPKVRAALLEGPTGTGKTSAVRALANDMGWGMVEMNASDARNEMALGEVAGRAALTNTFTEDGRFLSATHGERNLILLDEAESISDPSSRTTAVRERERSLTFVEFLQGRYGRVEDLNKVWGLLGKKAYKALTDLPKNPSIASREHWPLPARRDMEEWQRGTKRRSNMDEGGMAALGRLVESTRQPLVLTANDAYPLFRTGVLSRENVVRIRFPPVEAATLRGWLRRVASTERLTLSRDAMEEVVQRSKGDLRAALNDLEALSAHPLGVDLLEVLGGREVEVNLFEVTRHLLGCARFIPSFEVMAITDATPDDLWPWIEENLPNFAVDPAALYLGFERLSRAQLHLARAERGRVWGLWSYASELLSGGVSLALHRGHPPDERYRLPSISFPRILSGLKGSRMRRGAKDSLLGKVGGHLHMSRRRAGEVMLPVLRRLYGEAPTIEDESMSKLLGFQVNLTKELDLDPAEIAYLLDVPTKHPSVTHLAKERK